MNSSPLFSCGIFLFIMALVFLLIALLTRTRSSSAAMDPGVPDPARSSPQFTQSPLFMYGVVGMVLAVEGISINIAYTMATVPYVISVKRLSLFFSVLFGGLLLHEQQIRGRMFGAVVMILGAVVIGLWG